jgi:FKBP-type peptidyl-prolyl cis-trans isomerase
MAYIFDPEFIAPGFELAFINISQLKTTIEENLSLFRYVLGPNLSSDDLVQRIAYSDELLCDVLKNDLTLVGIVLGFGVHNSLVGGKMEMVSSHVLIRDTAPFLPQHCFFQNTAKNNFIFPEELYRLYYLEFAGGEDYAFRVRDQASYNAPSPNFSDLEELERLKTEEDPLPISLQKDNPHFIFNAFKGGAPNRPLFERLLHAQKSIQSLANRDNFLETVLEKIGGKKPTITCAKPSKSFKGITLFKEGEQKWVELLLNVAKRFEGEKKAAFIDAFCKPTETSRQRPWAVGVSNATLQGLKRAKANLAAAEKKFSILSEKSPARLKEIVKKSLYVETTKEGSGKEITEKIDNIRVSYIVEDGDGIILFANHDTWLQLTKTITGFFQGVQGMRIGEKRTLFIHPTLAYGALTTLPPCTSLNIKIHLLDIDEQQLSKKQPLPAKPLDLSWVTDPDLYEKIESSLHQIPRFVGSFYRDWLDKRSELDTQLLAENLKKSKNI